MGLQNLAVFQYRTVRLDFPDGRSEFEPDSAHLHRTFGVFRQIFIQFLQNAGSPVNERHANIVRGEA